MVWGLGIRDRLGGVPKIRGPLKGVYRGHIGGVGMYRASDFPEIGGPFWDPYDEDYNILGSIWVPPI